MSLYFVILFKTTLHVLGVPCPSSEVLILPGRGGIRGTWGLGPTMTTPGQSIGISIGMLPQTLIMSRLDQLSQLGAQI
jgi:hypothetical protein